VDPCNRLGDDCAWGDLPGMSSGIRGMANGNVCLFSVVLVGDSLRLRLPLHLPLVVPQFVFHMLDMRCMFAYGDGLLPQCLKQGMKPGPMAKCGTCVSVVVRSCKLPRWIGVEGVGYCISNVQWL